MRMLIVAISVVNHWRYVCVWGVHMAVMDGVDSMVVLVLCVSVSVSTKRSADTVYVTPFWVHVSLQRAIALLEVVPGVMLSWVQ